MKGFVKGLLGAIVVMLVALAGLTIALKARAQVTDTPISSWPTEWTGAQMDIQVNPVKACIAGWHRSTDRYGDWWLQRAVLDCTRLTATECAQVVAAVATNDLKRLLAMRTINTKDDAAVAPCVAKMTPQPMAWIVAPSSTDSRPAYTLKADGTRGAVALVRAPAAASAPTRAQCWRKRSKETTTSTYCAWQGGPDDLVTLAKEVK